MSAMPALIAAEPSLAIGALEAVPHHSGALWLPAERALLVADLHLEKASCYAARGVFLPPYDTRATLASLAAAIGAFNPRRVIALGDSFHDRHGASRLAPADLAALAAMQAGRDWLWLTGNHDPEAGPGLAGDVAAAVTLSGIDLRHEPSVQPRGPEIAGHLHPAARISLRGRSVRRRSFICCGARLVMPAFGALTGGLNVRDAAIMGLFAARPGIWMLGQGRVFQVSPALLLPD